MTATRSGSLARKGETRSTTRLRVAPTTGEKTISQQETKSMGITIKKENKKEHASMRVIRKKDHELKIRGNAGERGCVQTGRNRRILKRKSDS